MHLVHQAQLQRFPRRPLAAGEQALARLGQAGPRALAATKELLAASQGQGLPDVLDQAAVLFAGSLRGAEAAEGLRAFSSKATPGWGL